jgi:hypothetical protein
MGFHPAVLRSGVKAAAPICGLNASATSVALPGQALLASGPLLPGSDALLPGTAAR